MSEIKIDLLRNFVYILRRESTFNDGIGRSNFSQKASQYSFRKGTAMTFCNAILLRVWLDQDLCSRLRGNIIIPIILKPDKGHYI